MSLGLTNLLSISTSINTELQAQSGIMEDIEDAGCVAEEKMRRVVRRAGRLNGRNGVKQVATFVNYYTWCVNVIVNGTPTRHYLGLNCDKLTLLPHSKAVVNDVHKRSVIWCVYRKNTHNAVGIKSDATNEYVGCNWFGNIVTNNRSFGANEEFEFDDVNKMSYANSEGTRLLCSRAAWGSGENTVLDVSNAVDDGGGCFSGCFIKCSKRCDGVKNIGKFFFDEVVNHHAGCEEEGGN
jgi:hypothetical protein